MLDAIAFRLNAATEYDNTRRLVRPIFGYLQDPEGYALMLLAASGPGAGAIVEIGSLMGRSTVWLAAGTKMNHREKVTAIDHFIGSPEHHDSGSYVDSVLKSEGSTFKEFRENIAQADVNDYVEPVVASSEEAVRGWDAPIRLLFIDGDHSYEESRKDFELWSPFVVPGGIVAFHDIGNAEGVTRFYRDLLAAKRGYEQAFRIISLAITQKTAEEPAP